MRVHEYQTIVCQDVDVLIPHPSEGGEGIPMVIPRGEAEEMVGCKHCEMGLEEALTVACPGVPLERLLEG